MNIISLRLEDFERPNWTKVERQNAAVVMDFIQHLMNNHDFDYIKQKFGNHPYKQHNQSMIDGIEGVLRVDSNFAKAYPDYTYDVKHVYVDGDFVTVHSHATNNLKHRGNPQKGLNIIDTWKVENGKLTEHWDAVQPIHGQMRFYFWMVGGKFKNSNTYL